MYTDITHESYIRNYIKDFEEKLDNLNVSTKIYDKNIKTLKVKKSKKPLKDMYQGYYMINKNEIVIYNNIKEIISHELLHVASTKYDGVHDRSGLSICNTKSSNQIGDGLNEGFTEYINHMFFNTNAPDDSLVFYLAKKLTEVISLDYMLDCYFKANYTRFYNKLKSIGGATCAYNIIVSLDQIQKYDTTNTIFKDNQIKKLYYASKAFVSNYAYLYLKKYFLAYYRHEITETDLNIAIDEIQDFCFSNLQRCEFDELMLSKEEYKILERKSEDKASKVLKI